MSSNPDTGATTQSFISQSFASRINAIPLPGSQQLVMLGSNEKVESPGSVQISYKFKNEPQSCNLTCAILPGLVHDLVLGKPFLDMTRTLMKEFRYRIKVVATSLTAWHAEEVGIEPTRNQWTASQGLCQWKARRGSGRYRVGCYAHVSRGMPRDKVSRSAVRKASRLMLEFANGSAGITSGSAEKHRLDL